FDFLNNRLFVYSYIMGGLFGGITFLLLYNFIPVFSTQAQFSYLLGSSASVAAIVIGAATLLPNYTIQLLFLGNVKLKYLAIAFIVLNLIGLAGPNSGGSLAHLGGALFGFVYVSQLQKGNDWSKMFMRRKKKSPTLKVVHYDRYDQPKQPIKTSRSIPNQEYIDT